MRIMSVGGIALNSGSEKGPYFNSVELPFPKKPEWMIFIESEPLSARIAEDVKVFVRGDDFWMWRPSDPRGRIMGGLVGLTPIAHLIVAALPMDDPRWASEDELPRPFFRHTSFSKEN